MVWNFLQEPDLQAQGKCSHRELSSGGHQASDSLTPHVFWTFPKRLPHGAKFRTRDRWDP